jgi:glucose-1-phosphate cytidylyltransferase
MKTVILCGGQGTRMREETEYRPKPLVEIGGRPVLWHIMKTYSHYGFRDFILCLGYKGEKIKEYFLNYEAMNNDFTVCLGRENVITYHGEHTEQDFRVTLVDTGAATMTGGRVKRVQRYIGDEPFMVTYGDGLADIDVESVMQFHKSHGRIGTVSTGRPSSRFGLLEADPFGQVNKFVEKPVLDGWANIGYLVFQPEIFRYLGSDDCVLEGTPLETLATDHQLYAYHHTGFFYAMDTYREYLALNDLWNSGGAPWKVWI